VAASKIKSECQSLLAQWQQEFNILRKQREEKVDERLNQAEVASERAIEEGRANRDQFKALQDDRKRDVEETAEFIKQIIAASK
jgi:hypothetical protein